MDPVEYLSQARFHRSIRYGDGTDRISFALVGAWPHDVVNRYDVMGDELQHSLVEWQANRGKPIVLYVLPSGCSRYIGVLLSAIAQENDVAILAIDRPGAGATPSCDVHQRIDRATEHTLYVLQHLGIQRVDILTHSVGWLYALELLSRAPSLVHGDRRAKIIFSSPFVPTTQSGSALAWLPQSVVTLAPHAFDVLSTFDRAFTWSAGLVPTTWSASSPSEQDDEKQRAANKRKKPQATFHPPYRPHARRGNGLEAWKENKSVPRHPRTGRRLTSGEKLLLEYFAEEGGVKAATQDFLLCLGKVKGMESARMVPWIQQKLANVGAAMQESLQAPQIVLVWAENDGLIPLPGRRYLNDEFDKLTAAYPAIELDRWTLADAGHDAGLASSEVMKAVFYKFNEA